MKRALIAVAALVPVPAVAQPVTQGGAGTPGDSPLTMDPGSAPDSRRSLQPPPPPPPQQQQPNVIVVGPDGKVTSSQPAPEEKGYYASGGQAAPTDQPEVIHTGPTPELHVVRRGDTLWDISFLYFNDPWQWPKVWSYNPQITNPHWIYPGDLVRLLPRGMFVSTTPGPTDPEKTPDDVKPTDPVPAPAKRTDVGVKQTAFVEKKNLDTTMRVVGSVDEKEMLGTGDSVYISYPEGKPPKVGQQYSVYVPGSQAKQGEKVFGSYVQILGTVEIASVKQDKQARGVITQANQEIERGALVGPLAKTYKNVPPVAPKVDAQGPIVALLTRDQLIGEGEVVFVGLGKANGLAVGNRMFVVRRGDALPKTMSHEEGRDDRKFPARALGEIVIVEVGDKVSVGLVTLSVQEMGVGDLVLMQKSE